MTLTKEEKERTDIIWEEYERKMKEINDKIIELGKQKDNAINKLIKEVWGGK